MVNAGKNLEKGSLFGVGMVMYGTANLLFTHPRGLSGVLSRIFKDYVFESYKKVSTIRYIDTDLEGVIAAQSEALRDYLSFIPFLVGSLGFLKWTFGKKVRQDVCLFMADIKDLFLDAGFVFENAPTKLRSRQSPGMGLKVLHFLDRPRNCFPSLHVILASYSYLKTKELIDKYSAGEENGPANDFLFAWSLNIIESCLLTKQHSLRDIAGGLAVVSAKFPNFKQEDIEQLISIMFTGPHPGFTEDTAALVRKEIGAVYSMLISSISSQNGDCRSVLVDYVRSI